MESDESDYADAVEDDGATPDIPGPDDDGYEYDEKKDKQEFDESTFLDPPGSDHDVHEEEDPNEEIDIDGWKDNPFDGPATPDY